MFATYWFVTCLKSTMPVSGTYNPSIAFTFGSYSLISFLFILFSPLKPLAFPLRSSSFNAAISFSFVATTNFPHCS